MRKKWLILCLSALLLIPLSIFGKGEPTLLVPLKGEINQATVEYVRNAIEYAEAGSYKGIVFEIDTYGGLIDSAEAIKNYILNTTIPTVSYVNTKAESAGVLLAISSEYMVMHKSGTIGSAETVPNTEKNLSFWRSLLRSTAQERGRNETVIEAMADSSIEIPNVSQKGKLLNLTAKESLDLGVSDGIVNSVDEALTILGLSETNIEEFSPNMKVRLARIISNPVIVTILIVVGMVGAVVEIFTPGFGVGGVLSILSFSLFFLGNIVAGYSNLFSLGLFILGLILIVLEIFIPGFGIPGISGIICVIVGLILAMESLEVALTTLAIAIVITGIVSIYLIKKGMRSKFIDRITLKASSTSDRGYNSNILVDLNVGDKGVAFTDLRPSGFISINENKIDALSDDGFIKSSSDVEIIRIEGAKIFVRRI